MESKEFKQQLKDLPNDLYADIEKLLANYGVNDVKVTRIQLKPTAEILDKTECEKQNRVWHCDIVEGEPPYCRCLKKPR